MYSAIMSCRTMPNILKLLLHFNPNFNPNFFPVDCAPDSRVVIERILSPTTLQANWKCVTKEHPWVMMQEYKPNFLWTIHKFNETELENCLGLPKGELQCYSRMANSKCTLQNLTSQCQWK